MTYSIKITNKNIDYDVTPEILNLSTISPTLITDPNTPYVEYQSDNQNESTSVFIPLYKRSQYVELKAGSVLIIQTEDSDEAIYYRNMELDNATILCDPDPISGGSSGPVLIEKTITENGTYNASDDDADGYSSVTVDIQSLPTRIQFGLAKMTSGTPSLSGQTQSVKFFICPNDGIFTLPTSTMDNVFIVGDVKRFNADDYGMFLLATFKAGEDFDGVYINNTKKNISGVTISTGNWYTILVYNGNITGNNIGGLST